MNRRKFCSLIASLPFFSIFVKSKGEKTNEVQNVLAEKSNGLCGFDITMNNMKIFVPARQTVCVERKGQTRWIDVSLVRKGDSLFMGNPV